MTRIVSTKHPLARRVGMIVMTASAVLAMVAGNAVAARSDAKLKLDDACTFLTEQQIGAVFGEPVEEIPVHFVGGFDCVYDVAGGPSVPGGGRFQTYQLYPNFAVGLENARSAYVDERAIDTLSESNLKDLEDVGKAAFVNYTENHLTVHASRKFAFTLIWEDSDPSAELQEADVKKLVTLAKKVIRRAAK